jgi:hypothetical protein
MIQDNKIFIHTIKRRYEAIKQREQIAADKKLTKKKRKKSTKSTKPTEIKIIEDDANIVVEMIDDHPAEIDADKQEANQPMEYLRKGIIRPQTEPAQKAITDTDDEEEESQPKYPKSRANQKEDESRRLQKKTKTCPPTAT